MLKERLNEGPNDNEGAVPDGSESRSRRDKFELERNFRVPGGETVLACTKRKRKRSKSHKNKKSKKGKRTRSSSSETDSSESESGSSSNSDSDSDSDSEDSASDSFEDDTRSIRSLDETGSVRLPDKISRKWKLEKELKRKTEKYLKGISKAKRIKITKRFPLPKHRCFKGLRIDSFVKNLYKSEGKRFNFKVDKNMANQASRCLDAMGPILRLQSEVELASDIGHSIPTSRILQFTKSALKLMGNAYQVGLRERRKVVLKPVLPDNTEILENAPLNSNKHLFGDKVRDKLLQDATLSDKFSSLVGKKNKSDGNQFFQGRPGRAPYPHRPGYGRGRGSYSRGNYRGGRQTRGHHPQRR